MPQPIEASRFQVQATSVGSFVCIAQRYRASAGLPDEPGVVLAGRRRDARLTQLPSLRGSWVPWMELSPAPEALTAEQPLATLRRLLGRVPPLGLELGWTSGGGLSVKLVTRAVSLELLEELEALGCKQIRVAPESMSKLGLVLLLTAGGASQRGC